MIKNKAKRVLTGLASLGLTSLGVVSIVACGESSSNTTPGNETLAKQGISLKQADIDGIEITGENRADVTYNFDSLYQGNDTRTEGILVSYQYRRIGDFTYGDVENEQRTDLTDYEAVNLIISIADDTRYEFTGRVPELQKEIPVSGIKIYADSANPIEKLFFSEVTLDPRSTETNVKLNLPATIQAPPDGFKYQIGHQRQVGITKIYSWEDWNVIANQRVSFRIGDLALKLRIQPLSREYGFTNKELNDDPPAKSFSRSEVDRDAAVAPTILEGIQLAQGANTSLDKITFTNVQALPIGAKYQYAITKGQDDTPADDSDEWKNFDPDSTEIDGVKLVEDNPNSELFVKFRVVALAADDPANPTHNNDIDQRQNYRLTQEINSHAGIKIDDLKIVEPLKVTNNNNLAFQTSGPDGWNYSGDAATNFDPSKLNFDSSSPTKDAVVSAVFDEGGQLPDAFKNDIQLKFARITGTTDPEWKDLADLDTSSPTTNPLLGVKLSLEPDSKFRFANNNNSLTELQFQFRLTKGSSYSAGEYNNVWNQAISDKIGVSAIDNSYNDIQITNAYAPQGLKFIYSIGGSDPDNPPLAPGEAGWQEDWQTDGEFNTKPGDLLTANYLNKLSRDFTKDNFKLYTTLVLEGTLASGGADSIPVGATPVIHDFSTNDNFKNLDFVIYDDVDVDVADIMDSYYQINFPNNNSEYNNIANWKPEGNGTTAGDNRQAVLAKLPSFWSAYSNFFNIAFYSKNQQTGQTRSLYDTPQQVVANDVKLSQDNTPGLFAGLYVKPEYANTVRGDSTVWSNFDGAAANSSPIISEVEIGKNFFAQVTAKDSDPQKNMERGGAILLPFTDDNGNPTKSKDVISFEGNLSNLQMRIGESIKRFYDTGNVAPTWEVWGKVNTGKKDSPDDAADWANNTVFVKKFTATDAENDVVDIGDISNVNGKKVTDIALRMVANPGYAFDDYYSSDTWLDSQNNPLAATLGYREFFTDWNLNTEYPDVVKNYTVNYPAATFSKYDVATNPTEWSWDYVASGDPNGPNKNKPVLVSRKPIDWDLYDGVELVLKVTVTSGAETIEEYFHKGDETKAKLTEFFLDAEAADITEVKLSYVFDDNGAQSKTTSSGVKVTLHSEDPSDPNTEVIWTGAPRKGTYKI